MSEQYLYSPDEYDCTDRIDLKKYFRDYRDDLQSNIKVICENSEENLIEHIGLTKNQFNALQAKCSPENLTVFGEVKLPRPKAASESIVMNPFSFPIPEHGKKLEINLMKQEWENTQTNINYFSGRKIQKSLHLPDLTPYKDVVVTVSINHSGECKYSEKNDPIVFLKCTSEINIISTQTLAQLRDVIECPSDLGFCRELSKPEVVKTSLVKEKYPSGFFLIENCFYNDMRHPNAKDYSKLIRKSADKRKIIKFSVGDMENTKIEDLNVRCGYPYLYLHQGDCEHLLVFTDFKLIDKTDALEISQYPYISHEGRKLVNTCFICVKKPSEFIITESDRLPYNFSHLCKECLMSYHYVEGKPIGEFKMYPVFQ